MHVISVRFNESSWFNWIWSYPHFSEEILPHIVSKYFVHLAISLCAGPQGEHRLHCSLSVMAEKVSPSRHWTHVINTPYGTVLPQGWDGSKPEGQIGQSRHSCFSCLDDIQIIWSGWHREQTTSEDGLQGFTTVSFGAHCEQLLHDVSSQEEENVLPGLHDLQCIVKALLTRLPHGFDNPNPGGHEGQGQQSCFSVSESTSSISLEWHMELLGKFEGWREFPVGTEGISCGTFQEINTKFWNYLRCFIF